MSTSIKTRDFGTGAAKDVRAELVAISGGDPDEVYIPYHIAEVAPQENRVSGIGSATGTSTTAVTGMDAPGDNSHLYVDGAQFANKGATAVLVTLQDGSGGTAKAYVFVPAGATVVVDYRSPLKLSENTALYFAADGSTTTLYVSAQGHVAAWDA